MMTKPDDIAGIDYVERKDYRVEVRVKNARLHRAIYDVYGSVAEFCRQHALPQVEVGQLIAMKKSGRLANGQWRLMVEKVATALRSSPEDLFNEQQATSSAKSNVVVRELNAEQVFAHKLFQDNDPSAPRLADESKQVISEALAGAELSKNERYVLERHYGLDGEGGVTKAVIATELDLSRPRIDQIESKALRKLRHTAIDGFSLGALIESQ